MLLDAVKPVHQVILSVLTIVLVVRKTRFKTLKVYTQTVCSLSCDSGYTPSVNCTSCVLTNICEASNPCGTADCSLGSIPDQYTCYCAANRSS